MKKLTFIFLLTLITTTVLLPRICAKPQHTFQVDCKRITGAHYAHRIQLTPLDSNKNAFTTLEAFLQHIKNSPKDSVAFTRTIAKTADRYHLNHYGFVFRQSTDAQGHLCFHLLANKTVADPAQGERITLDTPYDPNHTFQKVLERPQTADRQSKLSLSFPSRSGNILLIPRGAYVSLYDFSKKASQEEISDLWLHTHEVAQQLNHQGTHYTLTAHVGSHGYQVVPHLHMRLEIQSSK